MTLSSRWKSALVGIIGRDTIHNSFDQDLLQAPGGIMIKTSQHRRVESMKLKFLFTFPHFPFYVTITDGVEPFRFFNILLLCVFLKM